MIVDLDCTLAFGATLVDKSDDRARRRFLSDVRKHIDRLQDPRVVFFRPDVFNKVVAKPTTRDEDGNYAYNMELSMTAHMKLKVTRSKDKDKWYTNTQQTFDKVVTQWMCSGIFTHAVLDAENSRFTIEKYNEEV